METAILELGLTLKNNNPQEPVRIDHLGLDMTLAWGHVEALIRKLHFIQDLEYRIIMLSGDSPSDSLPENVQSWIKDGFTQHQIAEKRKVGLEKSFNVSGKRLKCTIRAYCDLPVIHGVRIRSPASTGFIAMCRWGKAGEYEWGGEEYRRIANHSCSASHLDILDMFDKSFDHYWWLAETTPSLKARAGKPTPP